MKILIKKNSKDKWVEVESAVYEFETDLQKLIADSPSLIPVEEIMEKTSPFIFAVREYGLPGSGYTDILLFNKEGNIGIIECKLASNVEIKRKVIGQILEYAAFLWNMTYEEINQKIEQISDANLATCIANQIDDEDWDEESFRVNIQDTLANGTFNLIIAVDQINDELKRTIDYLNECGSTAFSFHALELNMYKSDQTEMLIPHLYGKVPQIKKSNLSRSKFWSEKGFLEHTATNVNRAVKDIIVDILAWAKINADRVVWGKGRTYGSFTFHYLRNSKIISVFTITSIGVLYLNYGYLSSQIAHDKIEAFHNKIILATAFQNIPYNIKGFPSVNIEDISDTAEIDIDIFKKAVLGLLE